MGRLWRKRWSISSAILRRSEFIIVTIPEALGVKQTERIIKDFDEYQLKVNHLIVNYVIQEADCEFHQSEKRDAAGLHQDPQGSVFPSDPADRGPSLPRRSRGWKGFKKVQTFLFRENHTHEGGDIYVDSIPSRQRPEAIPYPRDHRRRPNRCRPRAST